MTPEELRADSDWQNAFGFACNAGNPVTRECRDFGIDDVEEVVTAEAGVFRCKGGAYLYLTAWCYYTGWDCRSGGSGEWCDDLPTLIACIPERDRKRLSLEARQ